MPGDSVGHSFIERHFDAAILEVSSRILSDFFLEFFGVVAVRLSTSLRLPEFV